MRRHRRSHYRDESLIAMMLDASGWIAVPITLLLGAVLLAVIGVASALWPPLRAMEAGLRGGVAIAIVFVLAAYWIGLGERLARRRRLERLVDRHRLDALTPIEFEEVVNELFQLRGYVVTENRRPDLADGGVDLEATKGGSTVLVQCKHWRQDVTVKETRELWGVVAGEAASGAAIVTNAGFTDAARAFANGKSFELIDGSAFLALRSELLGQRPDLVSDRDPLVSEGFARHLAAQVPPACRNCGKPMVVVTTLTDTSVTRQFWGCQDYPECQATRRFGTPYVGSDQDELASGTAGVGDYLARFRIARGKS